MFSILLVTTVLSTSAFAARYRTDARARWVPKRSRDSLVGYVPEGKLWSPGNIDLFRQWLTDGSFVPKHDFNITKVAFSDYGRLLDDIIVPFSSTSLDRDYLHARHVSIGHKLLDLMTHETTAPQVLRDNHTALTLPSDAASFLFECLYNHGRMMEVEFKQGDVRNVHMLEMRKIIDEASTLAADFEDSFPNYNFLVGAFKMLSGDFRALSDHPESHILDVTILNTAHLDPQPRDTHVFEDGDKYWLKQHFSDRLVGVLGRSLHGLSLREIAILVRDTEVYDGETLDIDASTEAFKTGCQLAYPERRDIKNFKSKLYENLRKGLKKLKIDPDKVREIF